MASARRVRNRIGVQESLSESNGEHQDGQRISLGLRQKGMASARMSVCLSVFILSNARFFICGILSFLRRDVAGASRGGRRKLLNLNYNFHKMCALRFSSSRN